MKRLSDTMLSKQERSAINAFARRVRKSLRRQFVRAFLFGSKARGNFHEGSDIDIFVLVRRQTPTSVGKVSTAANDVWYDYDVDLSPVVYDLYEEKRNLEIGSPFFKVVYLEGIRI